MSKLSKALLLALFLAVNMGTFVAALDFMGAQWIWLPGRPDTGMTYPPGNATFRRDYYPMAGKIPLSANILITTDNAYTLYVNGYKIGTGVNFTTAQRYCVPLIDDCNVFAVEAENYGFGMAVGSRHAYTPAGVLAAIEIRYSDGFIDTIFTDQEWHGIVGAPMGFEQVAFDDGAWHPAFVEGPYPTTLPWKDGIIIPPPTQNPGPSLMSANWIWTNEVNASGNAPVGGWAIRKTIMLPPGEFVDSMTMDITSDNEYTLYINGQLVGSGNDFTKAQRYEVNFPPTSQVVIAVYAVNTGGPAGLIAAAQFVGCECGCGERVFVVSDGTWKYSMNTKSGFQNLGFDDSSWFKAIEEGPYGSKPWGKIMIPMTNSPPSSVIADAPMAPPASVVF